MSSGVGIKGTLGRCYPFYADLKKCVVRYWFVQINQWGNEWSESVWKCRRGNFPRVGWLDSCLFHSLRYDCWSATRHSKKRLRKAPKPCVGQRTRIILNVYMDSRRRHASYRWWPRSSDEKSSETTLKFRRRNVEWRSSMSFFDITASRKAFRLRINEIDNQWFSWK